MLPQKRGRPDPVAARVDDIVGTRGMSRSALERVLGKISDDGAGGAQRARTATRNAHEARYQKVKVCVKLPAVEGPDVEWHFCHPARMPDLFSVGVHAAAAVVQRSHGIVPLQPAHAVDIARRLGRVCPW